MNASLLAALRTATWRAERLETVALPPADLITVGYVLGELPAAYRRL